MCLKDRLKFLREQGEILNNSDLVSHDWIEIIRPNIAKVLNITEQKADKMYYYFFFNRI